MADEFDLASDREEIARQTAIKALSRDLPKPIAGECKRCGENGWTVRGVCTPCRSAEERR